MGVSSRWLLLIVPVALLLAIVLVLAIFATSQPKVATDATALARVDMALGGGKIASVRVTGPNGRTIPFTLSGGRITPKVRLKPGERVSIVAVVKRPGWIGWLARSAICSRSSSNLRPAARISAACTIRSTPARRRECSLCRCSVPSRSSNAR